jgi:SAM-dependent methyltransferase
MTKKKRPDEGRWEALARPRGSLDPWLDGAIARRERLADNYDIDFGQERVFPELVEAMLDEVPPGSVVLEVGAATGLLTRPLLEKAGDVTALEPSEGLLRRLIAGGVADSDRLRVLLGIVEDLPPDLAYDLAVVTFTPRRGVGLARLLDLLASRVASRIVVLLPEDAAMDWAYLGRTAASRGFDVRIRIVSGEKRRAVVLVADVARYDPTLQAPEWGVETRDVHVPYPSPRGTATRLVRYFLEGGDRAISLITDPRGVERLYGNLRTAVHRMCPGEVTVRLQGETLKLIRLPKATETENDDEDWIR